MAVTLTDGELVSRCRAGDDAAWEEFVERFSRYVYAIVVRGFGLSGADAEDVFQDVFARAYEHLHRLRDDEAVRSWLGSATRRLCIDRARAAGRHDTSPPEFETGEEDPELARIEEAMDVRRALGALPDACREVLDRFFARDESYLTIGAALDIPPGTIASRISRCLERLRVQFAAEGR